MYSYFFSMLSWPFCAKPIGVMNSYSDLRRNWFYRDPVIGGVSRNGFTGVFAGSSRCKRARIGAGAVCDRRCSAAHRFCLGGRAEGVVLTDARSPDVLARPKVSCRNRNAHNRVQEVDRAAGRSFERPYRVRGRPDVFVSGVAVMGGGLHSAPVSPATCDSLV